MYGNTRIGIKALLQCLLFIMTIAILAVFGADTWMILSVGIWSILIFLCFRNIRTNCWYFFFLISFFVFLMSGDIAELLFDKHYYLQFGEEANIHTHKCLFISLLAMWIGYVATSVKSKNTNKYLRTVNSSVGTISGIKQFSKLAYIVAYVLILINTIDTVRFVASYGYVAYYTSYSPILPSILIEIGEFAPLALCVYLSTFPLKKESSLMIKSFLVYSFLTLLIGSRSGIIYNTIFVICYSLYRNYTDKGEDVWITKKVIYALVLSIPFLLSFLFLYEYIRTGRDVKFTSFGNSIVDFFVNIGASSKVIKYGYEFADEIPKWNFYSLGETLNYFKYGTLFNLLDLSSIPARHTVEFALESHSFGDLISYLAMPMNYLNGKGTGSSFVAELFADFGYIGVALGSLIYGWLFKKISYISSDHWLSTAIKLFVFLSMLAAPRASFDGFIAAIFNINNVLFVFLIYLFAQTARGRVSSQSIEKKVRS